MLTKTRLFCSRGFVGDVYCGQEDCYKDKDIKKRQPNYELHLSPLGTGVSPD